MARVIQVQPPLSTDERRADPRVELELDVEVGLETENNFYTGLIQDISRGGVFVATNNLRPVGTRFVLRLGLPGTAQPIVVEAVVCWLREATTRSDGPVGMGLQFVNAPSGAREVIHGFLCRREPIFYDVD